jgi:hypothetical protein
MRQSDHNWQGFLDVGLFTFALCLLIFFRGSAALSRRECSVDSTARRSRNQTRLVGAGLALPPGTHEGCPYKRCGTFAKETRIYGIAMQACSLSLRPFVGKAKGRGVKGQL